MTKDYMICEHCGKPKRRQDYSFDGGQKIKTIWLADCDCEEKIEQEELQRKKRLARYKELKKLYKQAGFTRRQRGLRFKRINCEHKDLFINWLKDFKPKKSKGMYLYGGVGNGKTTAGHCLAKELMNKGFNKVYFYTMAEYLNQMQQTYKANSNISFDDLMDKWFNADAIFIDDFGRERYTDKRLENTFLFFDGLYNNCTTFFVISNPENMLRVKQIPEFEAIFDRFSQSLDKVVFTGNSYRKVSK